MADTAWQWDETLYAGSASHYSSGRMAYPPSLADALGKELGLDGTGRLLDVGCGPGSLTLLLAPLFDAAVGVDADEGMLTEARRRAGEVGATTIEWRHLRAEALPAGLGTFRVATFAQSFHWMDRSLVARRVRDMLAPGGAWVHVSANTHQGVADDETLPYPRPPWRQIDELVASYLGPVRRAGRGWLPAGTPGGEEAIMRQVGFTGPTRIEVSGGAVAERGVDEIVSAVFSLSSSAPHLFADRLPAFEADLRRLLSEAAREGRFAERRRDVAVAIWRP
ncbi:Ubiquinone/menaquinone biosynthesis C-methylase UbiE [Micromonospora coriariae]|uniref:Ubiquinone/menaquinone biosynthesis C-methylase UbiE n=1 Tax=Micromonospora coriariae TaxID=285665 RepID=A0A1C4VX32_9ACTN|nr:class I SAM-dependent methyltransferase [Micromonospora coriariae]SCE88530.1 Ubiquinone/menaquinone biosynthesis C-methylase UbiE [Micromonospora coriariae]